MCGELHGPTGPDASEIVGSGWPDRVFFVIDAESIIVPPARAN